jgi:hypothetical protein
MEEKKNQLPPAKPGGKGPKFNISWIYGIIVLVLIGSYFWSDKVTVKEISSYPVFKQYVIDGYIESIEVFPQKNLVEAVVEDSAAGKKVVFGENYKTYEPERKVSVKIPSADKFEEFISEVKFQQVSYKESKNYFELFLYSVLPFL